MTSERLNAICPYFAMFPLDYPRGVIESGSYKSVLDPFCGRGTTNMAARLAGLHTVGVDSSPVAHAIASSKLAEAAPAAIVSECGSILSGTEPEEVPDGEFWRMMYRPEVLEDICRLREALLEDCSSPERTALRAIAMGALHGPMRRGGATSYLSNQFPRTYASKPDYSVRYWRSRGLLEPPEASVLEAVRVRAERYYGGAPLPSDGFVLRADSTKRSTFSEIADLVPEGKRFDLVVTSPPYLGMYTYIPDQWLRNWFAGGPPEVEYTIKGQVHDGEEGFVRQLRSVWKGCADVCADGAELHVRYGRIGGKADPAEIVSRTLENTGWSVTGISDAGSPGKGRRTSDAFSLGTGREYAEVNVTAVLCRCGIGAGRSTPRRR